MRSRPLPLAALAAVLVLSLPAPARALLLRGTANTPGIALDVDVEGNLAYVADGFSLRIIDVSSPTTPVEIGSLAIPGLTVSVKVVGNLAYVASGDDGVKVIDVSDPMAPFLLGSFDTAGTAYDVAVAGNFAYVADGDGGLRILDVSDPAAPFEVGSFAIAANAEVVEVSGTLAYIGANVDGLWVIDVANPAAPTSFRVYVSPGEVAGLDVSGTIVYIADGTGGLRIVDVAPFPVAVLGVYDPPEFSSSETTSLGVDVVGTQAYVSGYTYPYNDAGWVREIDVSNPSTPIQTDSGFAGASGNDNGLFRGIEVSGSLVLVAADQSGLRIFATAPDCSNGLDDDGDGLVDFPDDPGCRDAEQNRENPRCQDGIDNDGDGGTDFDAGESALGAGNGDPDGPDPQCLGKPWRTGESGSCGLGFELAPALATLAWRRRRLVTAAGRRG